MKARFATAQELADIASGALKTERMFMIECESVDGGWVASCQETGKRVFARTAEGAHQKICEANEQRTLA